MCLKECCANRLALLLQLHELTCTTYHAALAAYEVNDKVTCMLDSSSAACDAPAWTQQLDNVFELTEPIMGRTDIIRDAMLASCGSNVDFLQVSLTWGGRGL